MRKKSNHQQNPEHANFNTESLPAVTASHLEATVTDLSMVGVKGEETPIREEQVGDKLNRTERLLRKITRAEWFMILPTIVIAITGVLGAWVISGQLREAKETTQAARIQAEAAKSQADSAAHTLKEIQDSGKVTQAQQDKLIKANETLATAAKQQAETSTRSIDLARKAARASEESARIGRESLISNDRPIIEVISYKPIRLEADQTIDVWTLVENLGRGKADVDLDAYAVVADRVPDRTYHTDGGTHEHFSIGYSEAKYTLHVQTEGVLTADMLAKITKGQGLWLFVYGRLRYVDSYGNAYPAFQHCYRWVGSTQGSEPCDMLSTK